MELANGRRIGVEAGFDASHLRRLMAALEGWVSVFSGRGDAGLSAAGAPRRCGLGWMGWMVCGAGLGMCGSAIRPAGRSPAGCGRSDCAVNFAKIDLAADVRLG